MTPGFEPAGIWNKRLDRSRGDRFDTWDRGQPPHILVTFRLANNLPLETINLSHQRLDLIGDGRQGEARSFRQASIGLIAHDLDQPTIFAELTPAMMPNSDK